MLFEPAQCKVEKAIREALNPPIRTKRSTQTLNRGKLHKNKKLYVAVIKDKTNFMPTPTTRWEGYF